ncbi:MAG: hypothetical protein HFG66_09355 [Hungatella sp.]|nr:hypothetical protein [Hungatella sp.]
MGKDNYTEWDNATAISASVIPFSNREVKSSAFTQLFREPENAAQLYTALEGKEASKMTWPLRLITECWL